MTTAQNVPGLPPLPDGFSHGGDGYDWMELAMEAGWEMMSGWGEDGWDAGSWPYVIYMRANGKSPDGAPLRAYAKYVEGDTYIHVFPTRQELWDAIAVDCAWNWRNGQSDGPEDLPAEGEPLPLRYRVPYRWLETHPDYQGA